MQTSTPSGFLPIPAPRGLQDKRLAILSVLLASAREGDTWLGAAKIAQILRDGFGISIHWRSIEVALGREKEAVARRRRDKRWEYTIMEAGKALLGAASRTITLVDPSRAVQAVIKLHALLGGLKGRTIRICDPYLDESTIEHLDACPPEAELRVLTSNVRDSGRLRQLVAAARTQGRRFTIKRSVSSRLHDRYIVDDASFVLLGTSLNGFGRKQGFVTQAGPDVRSGMVTVFDSEWAKALPWP